MSLNGYVIVHRRVLSGRAIDRSASHGMRWRPFLSRERVGWAWLANRGGRVAAASGRRCFARARQQQLSERATQSRGSKRRHRHQKTLGQHLAPPVVSSTPPLRPCSPVSLAIHTICRCWTGGYRQLSAFSRHTSEAVHTKKYADSHAPTHACQMPIPR